MNSPGNKGRLLSEIAAARSPKQKITLMNDLAIVLCQTDPEEAVALAREALRLSEAALFKVGIARSHFSEGMAFLTMSGVEPAIQSFYRALKAFRQANDKWGESNALNNLGILFQRIGDYGKALDYYSEAIRIKEESGDQYGRANVMMSMTGLYHQAGRLDDAERIAREVLISAKQIKAETLEAKATHELGDIAFSRHRLSKAAAHYNKALALYQMQQNRIGITQCLLQQGRMDLEMGRFNDAEAQFSKALDHAIITGDRRNEAYIHFEWAKLSQKAGDDEEAKRHLLTAENIAGSLGEKALLSMVYRELSEAMHSRSDYESAFRYLQKSQRLIEEVNSVATASRLQEMETEKKIEGLEQEKRLMEIEGKLALEEVRRRISADLHDEVGAALSGLSIFSNAISHEIETGRYSDAARSVESIGEEARELLERLSDIVWAINPRNDGFDKLVSRLQNFAVRTCEGKNMELHFDAEPALNDAVLGLDVRNNFFLILKEAINNAAKYSGGTRLIVGIRSDDSGIHARVEDNGRGFNLQTPVEGNGLRSMRHRASEMNSALEIDSLPEAGTRVILQVPKQ